MIKITPPSRQVSDTTRLNHRLLPAICAALALLPLPAAAVGLGPVSGTPVIGEPLLLEVPLIEPDHILPECIQFSQHSSGSDAQFFPRKATINLKKKDGTNQTVVTINGGHFMQPIVEFRLTVGCGNHIARDYVLLAAPSRELRYEPVPINRPAVQPVAESSTPATARELGAPATASTASGGQSLDKMAKNRYPLQPRARAKFKRMVREANEPVLGAIADDAPIPADASLQMPANLPKKRVGPYIPKVKKQPPLPAPVPVAEQPPAPAPAKAPEKAPEPAAKAAPAKESKDRLTISSGVGASGGTQAVGAAEGSAQGKEAASFAAQEDMIAKVAETDAAYKQMKEQLLAMEARMAAMEQERLRLQQESKKQSEWAMFETALLVLAGGLLGAAIMIVLQRRRSRTNF